ncbi:MAG: NIPSNAP family protein [Planctomycetota bacterium]|jgi:hypothetical protein
MMKRRDFLTTSCLAVTGLSQMVNAAEDSAGAKQYLELRHYEIESAEKQRIFDDFLAKAAIKALNRLDIGPIGVFKMEEKEDYGLWVLLPHNSLESAATANAKMLADEQFQKDGRAVLNSSIDNPVYERVESSLLLAFDKCPKVEIPTKKEGRVFQLRIYESHNTIMAKKKIEMFNKGGEIALFRTAGMNPVFFGESIVGSKMPNLTYMLGFDNSEAQEAAWEKFLNDPEWKKLSSDPYYEDTVSNITNLVLRPAVSSQI